MEYVIVTYPAERPVYVNGKLTCHTNKVFRLGAGTHRFTLGPSDEPTADCDPIFFEVAVAGTDALRPLKIVFVEKQQG